MTRWLPWFWSRGRWFWRRWPGVCALSAASSRYLVDTSVLARARQPAVGERAVEVMAALAARNQYRGATPIDCAIAACAESSGLAILHYDDDFDRTAAVTGQRAEWAAPAGTLDR